MAALRFHRLALPLLAALATGTDAAAAVSRAECRDALEWDTVALLQLGAPAAAEKPINPVAVVAAGFEKQIQGHLAPGAGSAMPAAMQEAMTGSGLDDAPEQLLKALGHADAGADQVEPSAAAEQQSANWVAAMFSDKPDGEAIDATDSNQLVDKLTGYVLKEQSGKTDSADARFAKLFFTENRLAALAHLAEADNADLASAAAHHSATDVAGVDVSHGAHAASHQKFDLLPEPGNEEEAGQKWHIEMSHNQDAGAASMTVLGHGVIEHYLKTE